MNEHPAHAIVRDMEADVADVARWGEALHDLAQSENGASPEALHVIGSAVKQLGDRIDAQWKAAFAAGRGGR